MTLSESCWILPAYFGYTLSFVLRSLWVPSCGLRLANSPDTSMHPLMGSYNVRHTYPKQVHKMLLYMQPQWQLVLGATDTPTQQEKNTGLNFVGEKSDFQAQSMLSLSLGSYCPHNTINPVYSGISLTWQRYTRNSNQFVWRASKFVNMVVAGCVIRFTTLFGEVYWKAWTC